MGLLGLNCLRRGGLWSRDGVGAGKSGGLGIWDGLRRLGWGVSGAGSGPRARGGSGYRTRAKGLARTAELSPFSHVPPLCLLRAS